MSEKNRCRPDEIKKIKKDAKAGSIGGQAVIEGVMMKTRENIAIAVRRGNGEIVTKFKTHKALTTKHKILNVPFLRGVINFFDMMKLSMSILTESMEMADLFQEDKDSEKDENTDKTDKTAVVTVTEADAEEKKEREERKNDTSAMTAAASVIGVVLGVALSFGLFFYLPTLAADTIMKSPVGENLTENATQILQSLTIVLIRFSIFIVYILLVSRMKEVRRLFEYHGAEHMSIFAHERGEELTVENARKHSRYHPRCGTSFLIIMMLIGAVAGFFIPRDNGVIMQVLIRLSIFPAVIGVSYEFLKLAGKHTDNIIVKILSAPGIWMQRLTTKKPDDAQLEVAITSLNLALQTEKPKIIGTAETKETEGKLEQGKEPPP